MGIYPFCKTFYGFVAPFDLKTLTNNSNELLKAVKNCMVMSSCFKICSDTCVTLVMLYGTPECLRSLSNSHDENKLKIHSNANGKYIALQDMIKHGFVKDCNHFTPNDKTLQQLRLIIKQLLSPETSSIPHKLLQFEKEQKEKEKQRQIAIKNNDISTMLSVQRLNFDSYFVLNAYVYSGTMFSYNWSSHLNSIIAIKVAPLAWKCQRIIWIGYYHNQANKSCPFNMLSKDVIAHMLTFA